MSEAEQSLLTMTALTRPVQQQHHGLVNMKGDIFTESHLQTKNYRQRMTAGRRKSSLSQGCQCRVVSPETHSQTKKFNQQTVFIYLCICIITYAYKCKYICNNNSQCKRGYQLKSAVWTWEGLDREYLREAGRRKRRGRNTILFQLKTFFTQ